MSLLASEPSSLKTTVGYLPHTVDPSSSTGRKYPVIHPPTPPISINRTWFSDLPEHSVYNPKLWETEEAIKNYRYFNQTGEQGSDSDKSSGGYFFDREGCCRAKDVLKRVLR